MGEDGPAGGLLGGRFLLAMFASITVLTSKGLQLTTGVGNNNAKASYELSIAICLMFYPSFLLGVFSVVDFCSKDSLKVKILYRQPSLLLLPTFTCFTFSRISPPSSSSQ